MSDSSVNSSGFWVASASEVRRHYRKSVNDIVLSTPVAGRLLNISEAGMGVETRSPLSVRARSVFVLESGTSRRSFEGEVRWCRLTDTIPLSHGESTSVYRAGIAFVTA